MKKGKKQFKTNPRHHRGQVNKNNRIPKDASSVVTELRRARRLGRSKICCDRRYWQFLASSCGPEAQRLGGGVERQVGHPTSHK